MYHTAPEAEFQQLIQSVVFAAEDSHFLHQNCYFVWCNWYVPGPWFYYEYCCRVYLAYSVVGTRDPEVWLTLIHAWRRFLSVPRRFTWCLLWSIIVLLLLLYTIHFGVGQTGISCMCYTIFMQGTICEKTFRSFQEVILLTYSETTSPSRTSIGSVKWTIYIEVRCIVSYIFEGGGKFHRHQPRERHYIHGCTWYIWLLCAQWWAV